MKIIILSDSNSIHTLRWVYALKKKGFNLVLFSFFMPNKTNEKKYKKINVKVISPNLRSKINDLRKPNLSKINYLLSLKMLKSEIVKFNPDLIHAHYASSYGFIAFLSGFKPFILSAWGSDIYDFPKRNFINHSLIKKVLGSATIVCSTSYAMKNIIENDFKIKDVAVIPFGIDINTFIPKKNTDENFIVGTIKSIEKHNGIDCLLKAAKIIINNYQKDIDFLIVGKGTELERMKSKARDYKIDKNVFFTGFIEHDEIVDYYSQISVFVAMSSIESFGVAILEAASCEIPSITSDIGGLTEVNLDRKTGYVIDKNDPPQLAKLVLKLYEDGNLRNKLGKNARKNVIKNFNWEKNVSQMEKIYKKFK